MVGYSSAVPGEVAPAIFVSEKRVSTKAKITGTANHRLGRPSTTVSSRKCSMTMTSAVTAAPVIAPTTIGTIVSEIQSLGTTAWLISTSSLTTRSVADLATPRRLLGSHARGNGYPWAVGVGLVGIPPTAVC